MDWDNRVLLLSLMGKVSNASNFNHAYVIKSNGLCEADGCVHCELVQWLLNHKCWHWVPVGTSAFSHPPY